MVEQVRPWTPCPWKHTQYKLSAEFQRGKKYMAFQRRREYDPNECENFLLFFMYSEKGSFLIVLGLQEQSLLLVINTTIILNFLFLFFK